MQLSREQVEELVRRNGHIKSVDFDPVTRIAGALALHTVADLKERGCSRRARWPRSSAATK